MIKLHRRLWHPAYIPFHNNRQSSIIWQWIPKLSMLTRRHWYSPIATYLHAAASRFCWRHFPPAGLRTLSSESASPAALALSETDVSAGLPSQTAETAVLHAAWRQVLTGGAVPVMFSTSLEYQTSDMFCMDCWIVFPLPSLSVSILSLQALYTLTWTLTMILLPHDIYSQF